MKHRNVKSDVVIHGNEKLDNVKREKNVKNYSKTANKNIDTKKTRNSRKKVTNERNMN